MAPLRAVVGALLVAVAGGRRSSSVASPAGALTVARGSEGAIHPLAVAAAAVVAQRGAPAAADVIGARPAALDDEEHRRLSRRLADVLGLCRGGDLMEPKEKKAGRASKKAEKEKKKAVKAAKKEEAETLAALGGEVTSTVAPPGKGAAKTLEEVFSADNDNTDEHMMTVEGAELHAMEAAKIMLSDREDEDGEDEYDEYDSEDEDEDGAGFRLAQSFASRVQRSADFAFALTGSPLRRLFGTNRKGADGKKEDFVRISDAVEYDDGKVKAKGEYLDLSGDALEGAAELDMAEGLVPRGTRPARALSLLGLVAAMNHEAVFRKVQEALRVKSGVEAPYLSIGEYLEARRAKGAADLVNRTLWAHLGRAMVNRPGHMCLVAATCLRQPKVHLVAWGIRLGAIIATDLQSSPPMLRSAAISLLNTMSLVELQYFMAVNSFRLLKHQQMSTADSLLHVAATWWMLHLMQSECWTAAAKPRTLKA